ncbi:aspartic peptidase domain-containing protein [Podospora aff. communis PSN243]|uniref:Aspartic peptidase domain-containing protein n=1 Tax=Podospora aff. communis PSN243 TaxID=3040156 RepID=A0AAV9GC93_9PEZI|nr:aspartic peptidase domain-containing protein [Podospora aff. communis PSN243]
MYSSHNMSAITLAIFLVLHAAAAAPNPPSQQPLHDVDVGKVDDPPKWSSLPIRLTDLGPTINITIGNPPQTIPVNLDISSPNCWIIPTTLDKPPCPVSGRGLNTSLSESYLPTPMRANFTNGWIWGAGNMAFDMVGYGSLPAPFQSFIVASEIGGGGGGSNACPMAGFVGLAPDEGRNTSILGKPSHFERMVELGTLEKDLIALRLWQPAELSLGRVNKDLYWGDWLAEVPLTRGSGTWQTTASHLVLGSSSGKHSDELRFELDDEPATFSTTQPWITVPEAVYEGLATALGFESKTWLGPPTVDCCRRKTMPNITLNLAGQDITLTPYHYTEFLDGLAPPDDPQCMSLIYPPYYRVKHPNRVVLGTAFLRFFYTVFDWEDGMVRFAELW